MNAHVILGENIDTLMWITRLKSKGYNNIYLINYDYFGETKIENEIIYLSSNQAKETFKDFQKLYFYKSMYVYPGMGGKMSKLHKKNKDSKE